MKNNHKVMTDGLLPDFGLVCDIETVRMFSVLCERTCANLFAFSPYQLHLEREEFLHFQYIADELKSLVVCDDVSFESLVPLCKQLHSLYCAMMNDCWGAFVFNPDINADPGKLIVQQMMAVDEFDKTANLYKNSFRSTL